MKLQLLKQSEMLIHTCHLHIKVKDAQYMVTRGVGTSICWVKRRIRLRVELKQFSNTML